MLTAAERAKIRRLFVIMLCNLQRFDLYWCPNERRLAVRTATASKKWATPQGATFIGAYTHPFPADDFLGDLDDALAPAPGARAARA